MKTSRPYLIRAMHEWIIDCDLTPYALVDANHADVIIPGEYIEDGKILLNVSPGATQNLNLGNEFVLFSARFNGKAMEVSFPVEAVLAIYAKENGRGMMFKGDAFDMEGGQTTSDENHSDQSNSGSKKSSLAKAEQKNPEQKNPEQKNPEQSNPKTPHPKPVGLKLTDNDPNDSGPKGPGPSGSPAPAKKPSLTIVK